MKYYIRKFFGLLVTMVIISLVTFATFQILPGNPVDIILGVDADPLQVQEMTARLGLDRPLHERYLSWVSGVFKGNLGDSLRFSQPVAQLIADGIKVTGSLAVCTLFFTILIGLPLGVWLASNSKSFAGIGVSVFSQLSLSVPAFCMGIFLIGLFTVELNWFPSMGFVPFSENPFECLRSLFLPALSISLYSSAVLIRYIRTSILNQRKQDYVKTAKSKGISQHDIMYKHVLRNSLIPVITILGMLVADILGGSIIIENVFSMPGIGKLIATSISTRDLPLIQGLVLYLSFLVVVCNFGVDILYSVIDPRIRLK